jgi:hypothetical protein
MPPTTTTFDRHNAIVRLIGYFLDHQVELASQRPRVIAAHQRMVVNARTLSGPIRRQFLDDARRYATKLHIPPP